MRNSMIHRPNIVTRRAAAELKGADNRYTGVHPNNNNNHAALVKRFQLSTPDKLRLLGFLYTNTETPDNAHQLDAEVVAAQVTYTMTNTQRSYSARGESDRVPNTFKKAMGLPQTACWKAVSDKEVACLEKHGVFKLVPITRWVFKIKAKCTYKCRLGVQGVSHISGVDTPELGWELSLNRPEEKQLNEDEKRCCQRFLYVVNQLARVMSKQARTLMEAEEHLLCYMAGSADFSIIYKQGGFRLAAFSDANGANNPDNGRSTSTYIVMLDDAPISFKVRLQGLTAQSTMEAKLFSAALTIKRRCSAPT